MHPPFHRAAGCPRRRCFCCVVLRARSSFNQSGLLLARFHAVFPRYANNFRHDRQLSELGPNLVERQPEFRPPRHSRRFHAADVSANLRSGWQINPAARFERLKRLDLELCVFLRSFGAQLVFEFHQEFRSRSYSVRFERQSSPLPIRLLPLLLGCLGCCLARWFLRCLLRRTSESWRKRHGQNRDVGVYIAKFLSVHGLLPRNAAQTMNAHGKPLPRHERRCKGLKKMQLELSPDTQKGWQCSCRRIPPSPRKRIATLTRLRPDHSKEFR